MDCRNPIWRKGVVPVSPEGEGWLRESRPAPVRGAGVHRRDRVTPGNFGDRWQGKGDRAHHVMIATAFYFLFRLEPAPCLLSLLADQDPLVVEAARLAKVRIAKMNASGPSLTMARASASENPGPIWLRTDSRVSSASMLGMEQLHHAKVHFATATEALFKQSLLTEIHIRPRQSANELRSLNDRP